MALLSENVKVSQAISYNGGAAATGTLNGNVIDMAGYDGVMLVLNLGTVATASGSSFLLQEDTASNMSSATTITGSSQTLDNNNAVQYSDIFRPSKRYVRVQVSRPTGTSALDGIYIQYGGSHNLPVVNTGYTGEQIVNP